jgi:hypothetical protein
MAKEDKTESLKGYSELNLLIRWAEEDEYGKWLMKRSEVSVELLKAIIDEFRSRK